MFFVLTVTGDEALQGSMIFFKYFQIMYVVINDCFSDMLNIYIV